MRRKLKVIILGGLLTLILTLSIFTGTKLQYGVVTNTEAILSDKKIEWGIQRNKNHEQPNLGKRNVELIDKYNGMAIGSSEKKYIYVTFDLGYEAGYTEKILNVLKENNVKCTFFITAHYVNTASDLVQRMISEGHIVGNHTVNHYSIPEITLEKLTDEVMKLHQSVYEKFGYEMKYFRPPKGEYSEKTLSEIKKLGYVTVMWSFAYDDWDQAKQGREAYTKEKILSNIHNGCVMLLHATSKDNSNILDEVIKQIKEDGYEFKTLDEFHK